MCGPEKGRLSLAFYKRSLHSRVGWAKVRFLWPQRRSSGGVHDRSWWSSKSVSSTCVPVEILVLGWSASSSLEVSHEGPPCVAWSQVLGLHSVPLWTRAGRRGGSRRGDRMDGGLQKGEVGRQTRTSHVVRKSFGGRVRRGGESCNGMSFHCRKLHFGCGGLATGFAAGFLVSGDSLMSLLILL